MQCIPGFVAQRYIPGNVPQPYIPRTVPRALQNQFQSASTPKPFQKAGEEQTSALNMAAPSPPPPPDRFTAIRAKARAAAEAEVARDRQKAAEAENKLPVHKVGDLVRCTIPPENLSPFAPRHITVMVAERVHVLATSPWVLRVCSV